MEPVGADRLERASSAALSGRRAQRPRDSDAEAAILDAAEALLAEVRLHELRVTEIIERAGVSRATFYFYFSSKFAVVAAVLSRSAADILEAVQPWVTGDGDTPGERLCESIDAAGRVWMHHGAVLCSVSESWSTVPEFEELWLGFVGRFIDVFTEAVEQDARAGLTIVQPPARELVAALVWASERVFYVCCREAEPAIADLDVTIAQLQRMWLATVYGAEAATAR